jgi:hypothetical protein
VTALALALSVFVAETPAPWVRTLTQETQLPLYWTGRCFVYRVGAAGSARTPEHEEFAAIDAAFASWQAAADGCGNGWTYLKGAALPVKDYRVGFVPRAINENVVLFREVACRDVVPFDDPCRADPKTAPAECANKYQCFYGEDRTIAKTLVTYNPKTGEIWDTDIEFNASPKAPDASGRLGEPNLFTTVDSPPCEPGAVSTSCVAFDVQNTMTHELGHAMGFAHAASPDSTMYFDAAPGEVSKRRIDPGTAAGFCAVYPRGPAPERCEDPSTIGSELGSRPLAIGSTGCAAAPGLPLAALILLALRRQRSLSLRERGSPPSP